LQKLVKKTEGILGVKTIYRFIFTFSCGFLPTSISCFAKIRDYLLF
jgi:hypothetical protein